MTKLRHIRVRLPEANAFVSEHHRHHKPVVGHLFSIGAVMGDKLVGVAIVGRPVARMRDDGVTAEVTRLCTDGTRNACSFLYGASARAAFALGFQRIGTYILASETGGTLNAAGWRMIGETKGGSWSRPSRGRTDKHPTQPKMLFESTPTTS
ncbi:XF1762 family protein [Bradyrhizobium sp. AUGA SZCCT0160]|uniref:XF1762 family protein n=1 Tax=Bradyrhizobium sp. AUGA SZCCT0160 TaxID=2807662 RepID=UPI0020110CE1|nr:XF1762 family protein [Bradyrhizobium sp. AUGA SZCCT0160]